MLASSNVNKLDIECIKKSAQVSALDNCDQIFGFFLLLFSLIIHHVSCVAFLSSSDFSFVSFIFLTSYLLSFSPDLYLCLTNTHVMNSLDISPCNINKLHRICNTSFVLVDSRSLTKLLMCEHFSQMLFKASISQYF